jgi:hypothetical protein
MRAMHPLHVLDSCVQNAVGLLETEGPQVVTQAMWSVDVARVAIRRVLQQPDERERLGILIRQVHKFAHSRAGWQMLGEHGSEVLASVPVQQVRAATSCLANAIS